jgi:exodeoxyribonuclease VIII
VEPEPPFLTAVYRLDDDLAAYGRERYDTALDVYVRCLDSGVWPGYGEAEGVTTLEAPGWIATTRAIDDIW